MALLEEQLKVEERIRTMRIQKEADKTARTNRDQKPSTSREKPKNPTVPSTVRSKHSKQNLTQKKTARKEPAKDDSHKSMNISFNQNDTATLLEQLTLLESALKHRQHKLLTK
ncbi:Oidioi.mRNA.OKI2018_I69.chr2.g4318.t1.cds [Oikopleura dioica]|uniref:Oidioi.mRNA.OKI2018_I69.chr2.g4318.t1.cds n=1 Tax=Oikopleura dioica TaxID=34765 RepID=A0ABN7T2E3_OIKDI|nr:Oidioi.mRNA.OKI2018_I69.chr2.g4318.t1.cds [Oikopleura dioica]